MSLHYQSFHVWFSSKFPANRFWSIQSCLKSVDGQYVEEGWVDKTCKVCKEDTRGEPRQVDKFGRYVHVACLEKSNSGNFFTRLFSRWRGWFHGQKLDFPCPFFLICFVVYAYSNVWRRVAFMASFHKLQTPWREANLVFFSQWMLWSTKETSKYHIEYLFWNICIAKKNW